MPSFLHVCEGFCHGISSFLLSAHADCTRMAVRHAPVGVAERLRRRVPDHPGPPTPPPRIVMTRGRRRAIDTSMPCCPNPDGAYRGWVGWGNLRANGHPSGGPWRELLCGACRRPFFETPGTLFPGKRAFVLLIVRVIACLGQGVGVPGAARGVEGGPQPGL